MADSLTPEENQKINEIMVRADKTFQELQELEELEVFKSSIQEIPKKSIKNVMSLLKQEKFDNNNFYSLKLIINKCIIAHNASLTSLAKPNDNLINKAKLSIFKFTEYLLLTFKILELKKNEQHKLTETARNILEQTPLSEDSNNILYALNYYIATAYDYETLNLIKQVLTNIQINTNILGSTKYTLLNNFLYNSRKIIQNTTSEYKKKELFNLAVDCITGTEKSLDNINNPLIDYDKIIKCALTIFTRLRPEVKHKYNDTSLIDALISCIYDKQTIAIMSIIVNEVVAQNNIILYNILNDKRIKIQQPNIDLKLEKELITRNNFNLISNLNNKILEIQQPNINKDTIITKSVKINRLIGNPYSYLEALKILELPDKIQAYILGKSLCDNPFITYLYNMYNGIDNSKNNIEYSLANALLYFPNETFFFSIEDQENFITAEIVQLKKIEPLNLAENASNIINILTDTHGDFFSLAGSLLNSGVITLSSEFLYYNLETKKYEETKPINIFSNQYLVLPKPILNTEYKGGDIYHLGDLIDRGPESLLSLAFIERVCDLFKDKTKSKVHLAAGNHEIEDYSKLLINGGIGYNNHHKHIISKLIKNGDMKTGYMIGTKNGATALWHSFIGGAGIRECIAYLCMIRSHTLEIDKKIEKEFNKNKDLKEKFIKNTTVDWDTFFNSLTNEDLINIKLLIGDTILQYDLTQEEIPTRISSLINNIFCIRSTDLGQQQIQNLQQCVGHESFTNIKIMDNCLFLDNKRSFAFGKEKSLVSTVSLEIKNNGIIDITEAKKTEYELKMPLLKYSQLDLYDRTKIIREAILVQNETKKIVDKQANNSQKEDIKNLTLNKENEKYSDVNKIEPSAELNSQDNQSVGKNTSLVDNSTEAEAKPLGEDKDKLDKSSINNYFIEI